MALTLRTAAAGAALALVSAAGLGAAVQARGGRTVAVRDSLGRHVVLPARADRVLSLQPEITRIVAALGAGDRLVGADYFILKHDHLFPIVFPGARDLPAVSNTPEDMNFEMVLRLRPDVIFVSPTELQMVDALQGKLKRPVVALASMGSFDKLVEEIVLVGGILGREARAAELAADFRARIASIRAAVASVPGEERPRVYLSFWGMLTRTPVAYEPVDAAGGINCARGMLPANLGTIATVAQVEQILEWRPDVILIQGNYPPRERAVTTGGILRDKRFGSLPAVRNGRVFYTFGFWYWWDPALVLVETLYLARLFHPAATGPVDLEQEANAIFMKYYGVEGAYSSLCRVLECGGWDER
jgi:ABC-type Fe3+-hydroxamate transport system substrate-binding protein